MLKIVNSCDIVVVGFDFNVWVYSLKGFCSCVDFAKTGLMRLEEKTVHVRQLDFVVVEENQLKH